MNRGVQSRLPGKRPGCRDPKSASNGFSGTVDNFQGVQFGSSKKKERCGCGRLGKESKLKATRAG